IAITITTLTEARRNFDACNTPPPRGLDVAVFPSYSYPRAKFAGVVLFGKNSATPLGRGWGDVPALKTPISYQYSLILNGSHRAGTPHRSRRPLSLPNH